MESTSAASHMEDNMEHDMEARIISIPSKQLDFQAVRTELPPRKRLV